MTHLDPIFFDVILVEEEEKVQVKELDQDRVQSQHAQGESERYHELIFESHSHQVSLKAGMLHANEVVDLTHVEVEHVEIEREFQGSENYLNQIKDYKCIFADLRIRDEPPVILYPDDGSLQNQKDDNNCFLSFP